MYAKAHGQTGTDRGYPLSGVWWVQIAPSWSSAVSRVERGGRGGFWPDRMALRKDQTVTFCMKREGIVLYVGRDLMVFDPAQLSPCP